MTQRFFLFCFLSLFSRICTANIIIDIDVKLNTVTSNDFQPICPPAGCSVQWENGVQKWVSLCGPIPSIQYMPITYKMRAYNDDQYLFTQEATSKHELPLCLALPGHFCGVHASGGQVLHLLNTSTGSVFGKMKFTIVEGMLTLSLEESLLNQGYYLKMISGTATPPEPPQAMTSNPFGSGSVLINGTRLGAGEQINSTVESAVRISPNPFSQHIQVWVKHGESETVNIQLLNLNGQLLREEQYEGASEELPFQTPDIPQGFYFLRIQFGDRVYVQRVIKTE